MITNNVPYRCILVLYSHRGLVKNGYPNLKLFNNLHWIFITTMVSFNIGVFPLSHILKDNFPGNSIKGQICMKLDFQLGEMNNKQRFYGFIGPAIFCVFTFRFWRNCKAYVKDKNLNMRTFSQFGGTHHRNLFTMQDTSLYMVVILMLVPLDNLFIVLFQQHQDSLDKTTQFIIHNIPWILVCDIFFGIYIPLKHFVTSGHLLPSLWWEGKKVKTCEFYVRQAVLEPRRDFQPVVVYSQHKKKNYSYLNKNYLQERRGLLSSNTVPYFRVLNRESQNNKVSRINVQPLGK